MVSYAAVPGPISAPVAEEVVIKLLPVLGDLAAVTAVITALRGGVLLRVGAGDLGLLVEGDVGGDVAAVAEHGQGGGVAGPVALQIPAPVGAVSNALYFTIMHSKRQAGNAELFAHLRQEAAHLDTL